MAIRSGFFNSINGDRKYDAKRFAEYFNSFIGNGVFPDPSNNLQVMANDNMAVTLKAGKAWIDGYILINDDDYVLEIDVADGVLNRIDRIIARYDTVDREIRLEVKKGTFASSPVAPILQRDADAFELGLADIYVGKGIIGINQGNITDLRLNNDLCGVVHGVVDQVDVTTLFNQYTDGFEIKKDEFEQGFMDWFQTLQDVLDENTATNLFNMITTTNDNLSDLEQDLDAHKAEKATQNEYGHIRLQDIPNPKVEQVENAMAISGGMLEDYTEKLVEISKNLRPDNVYEFTVDLNVGNYFVVTGFSSFVFGGEMLIINPKIGANSFILIFDFTKPSEDQGFFSLTFPANIFWEDGTPPDLLGSNGFNIIQFTTIDEGITWIGSSAKQFSEGE